VIHEYQHARKAADEAPSLAALVMAAMLRADGVEEAILRSHFRDTYDEVRTRIDCPMGLLPGESWEGYVRLADGTLLDPNGAKLAAEDEPD
jgi:hypothetical protein